MRWTIVCLEVTAALISVSACGETTVNKDASAAVQDVQADRGIGSCEYLKLGPFVDLTPGTDSKSAGEVKADRKAYRLPLSSSGRRWVKYEAAKGELLIYSDTCVFFNAEDGNGGEVKPTKEEMAGNACGGITCKRTLDLLAGTHFFKWGPSGALTNVTMVLEQGSP